MSQTKTVSDAKLRIVLETALQEFVDGKQMFTAFDVTNKIRNEQDTNGIHVFHSVVKEFVHDDFDNGLLMPLNGYQRTLASFGNPPPWLYYVPGTHNPSNYQPGNANTTTTTNVVAPVAQIKAKAKVITQATFATFGGITGGKNRM